MWNERDTSSSSIMSVLFLIIIIWAIFGGGLFGNRGYDAAVLGANSNLGCHGTSNCDVEKQNIITTAETQFKILADGEKTREQASRIYEAQQAEKMFDLKLDAQTRAILTGQELASKDAKIAQLEGQMYTNAKFDVVERQLLDLQCNTPKRPPYYAQGFITCGQSIPANGCF